MIKHHNTKKKIKQKFFNFIRSYTQSNEKVEPFSLEELDLGAPLQITYKNFPLLDFSNTKIYIHKSKEKVLQVVYAPEDFYLFTSALFDSEEYIDCDAHEYFREDIQNNQKYEEWSRFLPDGKFNIMSEADLNSILKWSKFHQYTDLSGQYANYFLYEAFDTLASLSHRKSDAVWDVSSEQIKDMLQTTVKLENYIYNKKQLEELIKIVEDSLGNFREREIYLEEEPLEPTASTIVISKTQIFLDNLKKLLTTFN